MREGINVIGQTGPERVKIVISEYRVFWRVQVLLSLLTSGIRGTEKPGLHFKIGDWRDPDSPIKDFTTLILIKNEILQIIKKFNLCIYVCMYLTSSRDLLPLEHKIRLDVNILEPVQ